jgi:hypothetical protein
MIDLKIDNDNDIFLDVDKDLTLVSDKDQFIQRLKIKFRFFYKEWFLDQDKGIDFYDSIFIKGSNLQLINNIFKVTIMEEAESIELQKFELTLIERKLVLDFILLSSYGVINFNGVIL